MRHLELKSRQISPEQEFLTLAHSKEPGVYLFGEYDHGGPAIIRNHNESGPFKGLKKEGTSVEVFFPANNLFDTNVSGWYGRKVVTSQRFPQKPRLTTSIRGIWDNNGTYIELPGDTSNDNERTNIVNLEINMRVLSFLDEENRVASDIEETDLEKIIPAGKYVANQISRLLVLAQRERSVSIDISSEPLDGDISRIELFQRPKKVIQQANFSTDGKELQLERYVGDELRRVDTLNINRGNSNYAVEYPSMQFSSVDTDLARGTGKAIRPVTPAQCVEIITMLDKVIAGR